MPELFDTSQVPDDSGHWDGLAARVAARAARRSRAGAWDWFGRSRAGWVAASLLFAAALAVLMLPTRDASTGSLSTAWAEALAPADEVGKALSEVDGPPAVGALLLGSRVGDLK